MTHLVLVILAAIWAAVLLPPFLQSRSENRPADSISTFRNQLHVLERRSTGTTGSSLASLAPNPYQGGIDRARIARIDAKKRRRDILVTLLAAAGLTLVLSLVLPGVFLFHLFIDALLAGYVALLVRQRKLAEERAMKVRYMSDARRPRAAAARPVTAAPQLAVRRAAAN
ncbi:MAG TPA: hypothetical protein VFK43_20885 [Acidimicrobiales bacterium]|nr:hypothetical protein [Acidimicrobiales bacterium]